MVHRAYAAGRPRPLRFFRSPSQGHAGASGPCQHVGRTDSGLTTLHLAKVRNLKRIVRTLHGIFLYLIFVCTTLTRLLLFAQNKFKGISSAGRNLANGGRTNKAHEGRAYSACALRSFCERTATQKSQAELTLQHAHLVRNRGGSSPVSVQMWQRQAQSRCRCGRSEPSPGADVAAASQFQCRCGRGALSPGAGVAGASPVLVPT